MCKHMRYVRDSCLRQPGRRIITQPFWGNTEHSHIWLAQHPLTKRDGHQPQPSTHPILFREFSSDTYPELRKCNILPPGLSRNNYIHLFSTHVRWTKDDGHQPERGVYLISSSSEFSLHFSLHSDHLDHFSRSIEDKEPLDATSGKGRQKL